MRDTKMRFLFQSAATLPTLCSATSAPPELAFKDHPCVYLSATMHISNDLWLCFQNSFGHFLLLLRCAFILGRLVPKINYTCDNIEKCTLTFVSKIYISAGRWCITVASQVRTTLGKRVGGTRRSHSNQHTAPPASSSTTPVVEKLRQKTQQTRRRKTTGNHFPFQKWGRSSLGSTKCLRGNFHNLELFF